MVGPFPGWRQLQRTVAVLVLALVGVAILPGKAMAARSFLTAFLPRPESPVEHNIQHIYALTMGICMAIFFIVEIAIIVALIRFRARPGKIAATWTHHYLLEVAWTVVPVVILIVIAVPTYKTLTEISTMPSKPDLVVEVIGHQWYWEYRYPQQHVTILDNQEPDHPRPMVVPANKVVELVLTGADVIHDYFVPALGIKIDANPGRINHAWFKAEKIAVYDGQCTRLCGIFHSKMFLHVDATTSAAFDRWVATNAPAAAPPVGTAAMPVAAPMSPLALAAKGKDVFTRNCAACHQSTGLGVPGTFPPIAGSEIANGNPAKQLDIVIHGKSGPLSVKGLTYDGVMPAWKAQLSAADVAAVVTYERTSFGNHGGSVTIAQAKAAGAE
ncbi:MAG: cytochrome c oxidase subunit II [Cyanobacteria bacterium REEB65]|nr:cytochrome c oxidase subunit II [Cyanobacteria bacterium REEB65]